MLVASVSTGAAVAVQAVFVDDPAGDSPATSNAHSYVDEPYFDIVRAEIAKRSQEFILTIRLEAPIPATLPNPPGEDGTFLWMFGLDTQSGDIAGFPFPPGIGEARRFEFFGVLSWDGDEFQARLIDRTPLATGGEALTPPIPYSINAARNEVALKVGAAMIGDPASFKWLAITAVRSAHEGTDGVHPADFAPDGQPQIGPSAAPRKFVEGC
ncbi:hypothetical protein EV646_1192 [Kribbella antiqua]|uniref:Uncharacterized protein n=1 Tax=Kribbella antiqua TaxID=2512217 RepID=A0A4R2I4Z0_9ACTN|nr:hypothetical protein EV646_1192 [Kribbella antiqua]